MLQKDLCPAPSTTESELIPSQGSTSLTRQDYLPLWSINSPIRVNQARSPSLIGARAMWCPSLNACGDCVQLSELCASLIPPTPEWVADSSQHSPAYMQGSGVWSLRANICGLSLSILPMHRVPLSRGLILATAAEGHPL
jgi:hypothetical protein